VGKNWPGNCCDGLGNAPGVGGFGIADDAGVVDFLFRRPYVVRADEGLARAHEQIARADEQLARVTEQLAKMERDAARPPSPGPGPQSPPRRPALWALVGLPLAACIVVAALVLQSSYGGGAKLVVARWAPQLVSAPSLPPENPPFPAQPALSSVQVAAAEAAAPQAMPLAQTAPQDATPTATAALPDRLTQI